MFDPHAPPPSSDMDFGNVFGFLDQTGDPRKLKAMLLRKKRMQQQRQQEEQMYSALQQQLDTQRPADEMGFGPIMDFLDR